VGVSVQATDGEVIADSPLQQYGYVRCYRAVAKDCGIAAAFLYGVLEDYAQLGARTKKGCMPSHAHLAEVLECSEKSVRRYLIALRQKKWLTWDEVPGQTSVYTLKNPGKNYRPPRSILPTPSVNLTDNLTVSNKPIEQVSKPTVSHPPARGRGAYTQEFEERFWKPYPRTNGSKSDAFKAWNQLEADERILAAEALPGWLSSEHWERGYIKHAGSWLRERLWEIEPTSRNGVEPIDRAGVEEIVARARSLGYTGPLEDI
jgi:hypothetical protein